MTHGLALIPSIGLPELFFLFLIVLLIFGASKLPQLGRGLGEGISNFRKGLKSSSPSAKELPDGHGGSERD
jgi:sec-independent protein translocase protein TatA